MSAGAGEQLWDRDALAAAAQGDALGDWTGINGISIDTREIAPGDLFIALKAKRDGHDFVADALAKGARAALVSRLPEGLGMDTPCVMVRDTLAGLIRLAGASRRRADGLSTIAVTGSVGKTSVKEALETVLAPQGATHASVKSFNNHYGVPITLARMPRDTRFGVFEIGMNHSGEITPLSQLVRPEIAIITTVAPAHLGNFRDESEIAAAKAEIFEGLAPGGTAILNADNRWFDFLCERAIERGAKVVSFGRKSSAQARLLSLIQKPDRASAEAEIFGQRLLFRIAAPGRHHAMNALAVLAAAKLAGADLARAALDLREWAPGNGRGARQSVRLDAFDADSAFTLIDEAYNANPVSVEAALETLSLAQTSPDEHGREGKRIAVLGDMLELGAASRDLHAGLAQSRYLSGITKVHCCGPEMQALYDALPNEKRGHWAQDSEALAPLVAKSIRSGDAVMVKGSLGSAMQKIVAALRKRGQPTPHPQLEDIH